MQPLTTVSRKQFFSPVVRVLDFKTWGLAILGFESHHWGGDYYQFGICLFELKKCKTFLAPNWKLTVRIKVTVDTVVK